MNRITRKSETWRSSVAYRSCFFFFLLDLQRLHKFVSLTFCRFFRSAVTLLDLPDELLPLSTDDVQIVIRQFAPFFFHLTLVLLPFSFDLIPVHGRSSIQVST